MNGAIFFSGQYGSTAQYASWISEATGLPVFDVKDATADPSAYDFLILGSSVIVYKLTIRKWVRKHLLVLLRKPVMLFTVSGAPGGPKLDAWVRNSLPENLVSHMAYVALRGRLDLKTVSWLVRMILKIGAWRNKDAEARREELEGFDFMDKASVTPLVKWVQQLTQARSPQPN